MRVRLILVLLVVCVVFNAASAITVPSGSTSQRWDFLDDSNPAIPEFCYNPYGSVEACVTHAGTTGNDPVWADGVWSGSSIKFTASVPNTSNTALDSYKDIVVEIGYQGQISFAYVGANGTISLADRQEIETYQCNGETWTLVRDYYHIEPNPTSETICYSFGDFEGSMQQLDFVDIYTICVPEPTTICLLGLGGLIIRRRKTF